MPQEHHNLYISSLSTGGYSTIKGKTVSSCIKYTYAHVCIVLSLTHHGIAQLLYIINLQGYDEKKEAYIAAQGIVRV